MQSKVRRGKSCERSEEREGKGETTENLSWKGHCS